MSEKLSAAGKMMDGEVVTLTDDIIFTPLTQEGGIAWTLCQPLHSGSESHCIAKRNVIQSYTKSILV